MASRSPAGPARVMDLIRVLTRLGGASAPPGPDEPPAQALGQLGLKSSEVETRAVSHREQAAGVHHPFLQTERRGLLEIHQVRGDATGEGLELVVPLVDQV